MQEIQTNTLTARQAASYLGFSYWTLLDLTRQGRIKHFRGGNRILFRQKSLDEWIDEQEKSSVSRKN